MNDPMVAGIIGSLITALASISAAIIKGYFSRPQPPVKDQIIVVSRDTPREANLNRIYRQWKTVFWIAIFTILGGFVGFMIGSAAQGQVVPSTPANRSATMLAETSSPFIVTSTSMPSVTPSLTATITLLPTPTPECQVELAERTFKRVLAQDPGLASALGPKMMPQPTCVWSSYQPFENGEMIWRSDVLFPTDVYVLFSSGEWKPFKSNYKSGSPLRSCEAEPSNGNGLQPILGFGKVWCDQA